MFRDKSQNQAVPGKDTIIGPTVVVEGDFVGEGNMIIEGRVKGTLKTKQNLTVSPTAKITALIEAKNASIAGEVKGNITVQEQLELHASGRITGDIQAKTIIVAAGALINGKVTTGEIVPPSQVKFVSAPNNIGLGKLSPTQKVMTAE